MPEDASTAVNAKPDIAQRWGGRVPIVIGATGHRKFDNATSERLIATLKKECGKLKRQYRSSPFVVLSALAEGADRMIAKTAMEVLGADLIAVLPMPVEDYERDFGSEELKKEFRDLFSQALCAKIASVPNGDAWKVDGEPRNEQYARAGAMMVDHAQILFAIWDGKPALGTGGTADQVAWFERGYSPNEYSLYKDALSPLAPLEPGLRIRIDPASAQVSYGATKRPEAGKSDIREILRRTNRYNWDVAHKHDAIAQSEPLASAPAKTVAALNLTERLYRAANCLSMSFANKVRGSDVIVYSLAIIAVVAFNLISNNAVWPWVYLVVTLVMVALTGRVRILSVDNRFLEYRCLAEGMRTLFFWRSAGITRPVWLAFLSRQEGVVHWIRHAVRTVEFCQDCLLPQVKGGGLAGSDGVQFVKDAWVENQRVWFSKKERAHFQSMRIWKWIERSALGASFVTAGVLALFTVVQNAEGKSFWQLYVEQQVDYVDFWQLALGLFAASGLAARGFLSRRAHLELTKQYASQRQIFDTASRMLVAIEKDPKPDWTAEKILERLGEEALQEQSEWVWLRHTRPFELPVP